MASETTLETAKNETLRKIGRNLVNFQMLEQMLKCLIANGQVEGRPGALLADRERRSAAVQRQTMGTLVGQFLAETLITQEDAESDPQEVKDAWVRISCPIMTHADSHEVRKKALASIVAARNDLVHHFFPRFDLTSIGSCHAADHYLDQQREKILPEFELLRGFLWAREEAKIELAALLDSGEGKTLFALFALADISTQAARPDGWTVLSNADRLLRLKAPEEMAALRERFGHKTLKGLIVATGMFDLHEEPTAKGGIRELYRPKPGYTETSVELCLVGPPLRHPPHPSKP